MAVIKVRNDAPKIAMVQRTQITAYDAATTYKLTLNGKVVSAVGNTNAATTATDLAAAWNNSTNGEMQEVTATSDGSAFVYLTADTPGYPFGPVTSSVTGGAGTIAAVTTTTANSGPSDAAVAANYVGGALPGAGDEIWFEDSSVPFLYNLDTFSGTTFAALTIKNSYLGAAKIGLPDYNANGYYEYRAKYLKAGFTLINIGQGAGTGSGRIKIDGEAVTSTVNIYSSGTTAETGVPSILWKGTSASNVVNVYGGDVGVALFASEVATIATLNVIGGSLRIGKGATLTTINQGGGTLESLSGATTYTGLAGTFTLMDSSLPSTFTTVTIGAGCTVAQKSSGTITTLNVSGIFDCRAANKARTVTNSNVYKGASVLDPSRSVTWTNPLTLVRCKISEVTLDLGTHITLVVAAA